MNLPLRVDISSGCEKTNDGQLDERDPECAELTPTRRRRRGVRPLMSGDCTPAAEDGTRRRSKFSPQSVRPQRRPSPRTALRQFPRHHLLSSRFADVIDICDGRRENSTCVETHLAPFHRSLKLDLSAGTFYAFVYSIHFLSIAFSYYSRYSSPFSCIVYYAGRV